MICQPQRNFSQLHQNELCLLVLCCTFPRFFRYQHPGSSQLRQSNRMNLGRNLELQELVTVLPLIVLLLTIANGLLSMTCPLA